MENACTTTRITTATTHTQTHMYTKRSTWWHKKRARGNHLKKNINKQTQEAAMKNIRKKSTRHSLRLWLARSLWLWLWQWLAPWLWLYHSLLLWQHSTFTRQALVCDWSRRLSQAPDNAVAGAAAADANVTVDADVVLAERNAQPDGNSASHRCRCRHSRLVRPLFSTHSQRCLHFPLPLLPLSPTHNCVWWKLAPKYGQLHLANSSGSRTAFPLPIPPLFGPPIGQPLEAMLMSQLLSASKRNEPKGRRSCEAGTSFGIIMSGRCNNLPTLGKHHLYIEEITLKTGLILMI